MTGYYSCKLFDPFNQPRLLGKGFGGCCCCCCCIQHENKGTLHGLLSYVILKSSFVGVFLPIMSDWIKISSRLLQGRNNCIYMKPQIFGNKSKLLGKPKYYVSYFIIPFMDAYHIY